MYNNRQLIEQVEFGLYPAYCIAVRVACMWLVCVSTANERNCRVRSSSHCSSSRRAVYGCRQRPCIYGGWCK